MTTDISVVFVDDDKFIRKSTSQSLQLESIQVQSFAEAASALKHVDSDFQGVVVSDIRMPGMDGLELFERIKTIDPEIPVILITGHGDIAMAVQAIRDGAYDFLEKPFKLDNLIEVIRRASDRRRLCLENRNLRQVLELQSTPGQKIIGNSAAIKQLKSQIVRLANVDTDILLWGETGTGKDLVARTLHELSHRHEAPFVAINCGALPESIIESELFGHSSGAFTGATKARVGKFEHASGGTVFLDEIESMPMDLQVKLLRVLQERKVEPLGSNREVAVDIRVIAATKVDLKKAAEEGRFREDLYYRLNVITLNLPTLRERAEDIPLLFHHYALISAARYECDTPMLQPDQLQMLLSQSWPGNVRELKNTAERFVLMGESALGDCDGAASNPVATCNLPQRVEWFEKSLIEQALAQSGGVINSAQELLGLPRKTLYDKMQKYKIDKKQFKEH